MTRPTLVMLFLLALGCGPAFAQSGGFYLPTISSNPGQDEFRAADGTSCRSTMDGAKRIELGSFATQGPANDYYGLPNYTRQSNQNNTGVYGRFSMSLDASPDRIDCNKLYRLEIERRTLELELMKRSLQSADRRLDEQLEDDGGPIGPTSSVGPAPARVVTASSGKKQKAAAAAGPAPKSRAKVAAVKAAAPPP